MRVIAVDPGLTRCGVAVVDGRPGRRAELVDVGVIRTDQGPVPGRLVHLERELLAWLGRHTPDEMAVERVFTRRDVSTVMATVQASGVAALVGARAGLPVTEHTPTAVKAAVTGHGGAEKAQVGAMVARILGLPGPPRPADAADAVALALCHLWTGEAARVEAAALARLARTSHAARPGHVPGVARGGVR